MPRLRRLLLGQRAIVLLVLLLRHCGALVVEGDALRGDITRGGGAIGARTTRGGDGTRRTSGRCSRPGAWIGDQATIDVDADGGGSRDADGV